MGPGRIVTVALLGASLAGCQTAGAGLVRPNLPSLPAALSSACAPPVARAGEDARAVAARGFAAYGKCARKHRDTVAFYTGLQQRLGGKK